MAANNSPRNPVLLVHGIYDTAAKFNAMTAHLQALGWEVHRLSLRPNDGSAPLERLAQQVADYVKETFGPRQAIDLLGFSMGGVVTRYYLQRLGGLERVQRYVSVSAPNHGTLLAFGLPRPGVWQMRPGSDFLQDLNQDCRQCLAGVQVTIIWTPFDLMILPAQSSSLGFGREVKLLVPVHGWMVRHPQTLEQVAIALSL